MSDAHVAEPAVDQWERRTEWPLAAGAVLFLLAYSWPILDVHVSHGWRTACQLSGYAIWAIFAIDYATRIGLAKRRRRYVVRHIPDLVVVALPILRPLRLLRLVMLLRMLNRGATDSLRGRVAIYVAGAAVLLIYTASLAELDAERNAPHSNITGFGDAVWWAMTTVTTVGYGDRYPVTAQGRLVAAGLMIGGIALIGVITAALASWLIERVRTVEADAQAATRRDIAELSQRLEEVTQALSRLGRADRAREPVNRRSEPQTSPSSAATRVDRDRG